MGHLLNYFYKWQTPMQGAILIFMLLQFFETMYHVISVEHYKDSPNKPWSVVRRVVYALVVMWLFEPKIHRPLEVLIASYGFVSWWMHNYLFNALRNFSRYLTWDKPVYFKLQYLNSHDRSLDKRLKAYEHIIFALLSLAAATTFTMYFVNDYGF